MTAPSHPATAPVSPAELIAAHAHLVPITVRRRFMALLSPRYSFDDACQDGWLGLHAAAHSYDPARCGFQSYALYLIRSAIKKGAGRVEGVDFRRQRAQQVRSLDEVVSSRGALDTITLGSRIPDSSPGPEDLALDAAGLAAAIAAGRRAVDDVVDLLVLDWMLDLDDTRTQRDLAAELDMHPQAIWRRHTRLADRMRRAFNAPEV